MGNKGEHPIGVAVFLEAEGVHHAVVVVSNSLNLEDKGEDPFAVVCVYHAVVVVSESLDLGNKGENSVAVVVSFNSGSIQCADTVSCSLKTLSLLLCSAIAAVSNVSTVLAVLPTPPGFPVGPIINFLMLSRGSWQCWSSSGWAFALVTTR